jgi:site-specific recombinase XerD
MAVQRKGAINPIAALAVTIPTEDEARRVIFDTLNTYGEDLKTQCQHLANHAQNSWMDFGDPDTDAIAAQIATFEGSVAKALAYMRQFHAAAVARNKNPPERAEPPF